MKFIPVFDRKTITEKELIMLPIRKKGTERHFEWKQRIKNNFTSPEVCKTNIYYGAMSTAMINIQTEIIQLGKTGKANFLDCGCGNSPDADIALHAGFMEAIGVDLFPPSVNNKAKFIRQDICEKMIFNARTFDVIISQAVIDLMYEKERIKFYKNVKRLLKKNGIFSVYICPLRQGHGFNWLEEKKKIISTGMRLYRNVGGGMAVFKKD